MKRIFFHKHSSLGRFPDGRIILDVYFRDSGGEQYIWTPDWEKGTRELFLEAYRIERLNRPESPERKKFTQTAEQVVREEDGDKARTNFKLIAIELGQGLKWQTSVNEVRRI